MAHKSTHENRVGETSPQRVQAGSKSRAERGSTISNASPAITPKEQIAALEAEVVLYRHALESLREEMQAFAYSVSHDLRAPLRAIEGFSKIVLEDFSSTIDPEGRKFLQNIVSNSQHLSSQLDDLLLFYRLGKNPPRKGTIKPGAIVADLCKEQEASYPDRQFEFTITDLPCAFADGELLKHVFSQLVSNAAKFTNQRNPGKIEISGHEEEGATIYFVRDNGAGFDMQYADKLFQVFQKLHIGPDYTGNGIGLAIVKRIVCAHGGCVWAEAEPEKGACFRFSLPREESQQQVAA